MSPLLSIGLPVYNGARFVRQAIESIQEQTFDDWELIIVDDASDDDSVVICEGYVQADSRLRLLRNTGRLGLAGNWNRCLEEARGAFVNIFHQDDIILLTVI